MIRTPETNNAFAVIIEKIGDNNYSVITRGGARIEASYNRTDTVEEFVPGDNIYMERVGFGQQWVIASHAFGDPADDGGGPDNWFQFDVGPGFDVGHLAP